MSFVAGLQVRRSAAESPASRRASKPARITADSTIWLVLVAAAFVLTELSPGLLRLGLGTDEMTYIAQTSLHSSGVVLPPVHGRGPALLAAPITLFTTSIVALRLWMAMLSGIGLLLGLLAWRGLRRAWVIAVAGGILGCLGIAQMMGVQVMPDWWEALIGLAATGLFLQAVTGRMRQKVVLPLLAGSVFGLILLRPEDAAFLMLPLVIAIFVHPPWRSRPIALAIGAGIAAGLVEWTVEAFIFFGGPLGRLHMMHQEPPRFGFYFTLPYQLQVLNGPWYCKPGQCHSWQYPWLTVWWVAFVALIVVGLIWARRKGLLANSLMAVLPALSVLAGYTLFVPYAAPRYLLPVVALLAIPAADGIARLAAVRRWRRAGRAAVCAFLLFGGVSEHFVGHSMISAEDAGRPTVITQADILRDLGVHPPCGLISTSLAYYLGCAAPWEGEPLPEFLRLQPGGHAGWYRVYLPNNPEVIFLRH
jgi:hypothetical protein